MQGRVLPMPLLFKKGLIMNNMINLLEFDYEDFVSNDVIDKCRGLLESPNWVIDANTQKIRPRFPGASEWRTPWVHIKHEPVSRCGLWHKVMFDVWKFVPKGCLDCWKVVVRPKDLENLFRVYNMMVDLDMPSKCGAEQRESVFGLWGGYFYNRSLEAGLDCHKTVSEYCEKYGVEFQEGPDGEPMQPLLKRA